MPYRHKADKLAIKLQLDLVEPLSVNGTNQHSKDKSGFDIVKPTTKGGNSSDYLLAKIKRDRPDIAQRLADGECKSVRHAALKSGVANLDPF